eukprot:10739958-Lingulodinium_polyedra.AAC.1
MQSHDGNAIHAIVQSIATAARNSHARAPCVHQKLVFAWSARACNLLAVATARGRFDRIIVHGYLNRSQ